MSQQPQWFDTHAHLDYEYPFSETEYVTRAANAGVSKILTVGSNPDNWPKIQKLAESYQNHPTSRVYFSVGIHPHDGLQFNSEKENSMREYAKHPLCVALGEMGLDYYYDNSPRETQQDACRKQLALALELAKPVIIHSRDGEDDLLVLLKDFSKQWHNKHQHNPGVIHCFSGTSQFAESCLDLGFYISFSGIITFKKAEEVRAIAKHVPLNRILVETDSPYLAPIPYRGKQNESAYIVETAKLLAEVRGISTQELSLATMQNSINLFQTKTI